VVRLLLACLSLSTGLLGACAGAGSAPQAGSPAAVLRWEADAQSVEAQIEAHLRGKELVVQRERDGRQELLMLGYRGQGVPDFLVVIRANRSARTPGDTTPLQYMVVVQLRTFTTVPQARVPTVLEALNAFNTQWAYGAFYLDRGEEELVGVWPIRVDQGSPLPLDAVYDAIVMLVQNWYNLHPILFPAASEPAPKDAAPPLPKDAGPVSRAAGRLRPPPGPAPPSGPHPPG
jgi:hypothetical protein